MDYSGLPRAHMRLTTTNVTPVHHAGGPSYASPSVAPVLTAVPGAATWQPFSTASSPTTRAAADGVLAPEAELAKAAVAEAEVPSKVATKRPKRGERKPQILQTLALMLEDPRAERVTTAALAARLGISEAALYRHFSGKAQMFAALIEFIEEAVLGFVRQITQREEAGHVQAIRIVLTVLKFAETNPGMARVMAGDALVLEHPELQARMLRLYDKVESSIKQCLRVAAVQHADEGSVQVQEIQQRAHMAMALILGKIHRFVRSEFQMLPTGHMSDHALLAVLTA